MPKNVEDNSILLNVEMRIFSIKTENFIVKVEADVFFEFNHKPESIEILIEKECMPIAQNAIFKN